MPELLIVDFLDSELLRTTILTALPLTRLCTCVCAASHLTLVAVLLDDYLSNEPNLSRMHLVLMPSSLDAISQPVYPQWPLQPSDLKNISESLRKRTTVLPNPATFVVGGVVIGGTSTDVLFQLNAEDTMRQPAAAGGGAQRMEKLPRMAQHLIEQRSYFPIFPAPRPEETPLELSQLWHVGACMCTLGFICPRAVSACEVKQSRAWSTWWLLSNVYTTHRVAAACYCCCRYLFVVFLLASTFKICLPYSQACP